MRAPSGALNAEQPRLWHLLVVKIPDTDALAQFRYWSGRIWWKALRRRSQRARETLWWPRMRTIIDRWLPKPRILHPWPNARFAVKHPR